MTPNIHIKISNVLFLSLQHLLHFQGPGISLVLDSIEVMIRGQLNDVLTRFGLDYRLDWRRVAGLHFLLICGDDSLSSCLSLEQIVDQTLLLLAELYQVVRQLQ